MIIVRFVVLTRYNFILVDEHDYGKLDHFSQTELSYVYVIRRKERKSDKVCHAYRRE